MTTWGTRGIALLGAACFAALPLAARCDDPTPSYASGRPPYATGSNETIRGTIYSIDGRYALTLEDERGFEDSITLHDGTIIEPTGLSLGSGQVATITGHADGKTFDADEVDIDPATISNAQSLLPASNYLAASGTQYPGYAFGYNATAYGIDGFVGPYSGAYGNFYGNYYGGHYGGGNYSYQNPTVVSPGGGGGNGSGSNPPIGRGPVNAPPGTLPPGYRYPTGYRGSNPVVRPQPYGGGARVSQPQYRPAPQVHAAAPQVRSAPAAPSHSR